MKKILAFDVDTYAKDKGEFEFYGDDNDYKNIVALDDMTPKQRYETALADDENAMIYDDIDTFITDLNNDCISTETYFFYTYEELPF